MAKQTQGKLNWLEAHLPEGLLVDAAWLTKHGYSTALRSQYLKAGWLRQPTRMVYRRPFGELSWQQVVISLQTLLEYPLIVGGRTALNLHGYTHYLPRTEWEVHLYGEAPPPNWVNKLPLNVRFVYHNDHRLFRNQPITRGLTSLKWNLKSGDAASAKAAESGLAIQPWGQWDWPLTLSTPERALLEFLDELPERESFDLADKLMGSASNLSPRRMQKLLEDCRSVKVKRLFFFFADRHEHAWLKRLNKSVIDLGKGKRLLAKGGKLDRQYQITIPESLDAV